MKSAIVYARQSFGLEEGSASIEVQIENCQKWASKNNVNVTGVFTDANTSSELYPLCQEGVEACRADRGFQRWKAEQRTKGRKEFKEGLGKAFETIKAQKPDYIVVYTSNRLGRSATNSNLHNFMTVFFMEHNCSVVDVQSNSVTDFSDKLMMAFRAMKDALDYQSVAEKRRASMETVAKRINSRKVVSNAFAVRKAKDGAIEFDPNEAEVVKYVFDAVCAGEAYSSILNTLNSKHLKLARGKQWYNTNVKHILENLVYCGYCRNKAGEVGRATNIPHPIVSYAQWAQAQRIGEARKSGCQKYNLKENKQRHWLPWSGWIECACGRRMLMVCDEGIVYACKNEGSHVERLRINAMNHGQDFNLTMQALFAVRCIESRRELERSKSLDATIDALKCKASGLESAIKAKFRAIGSDEDYELLKGEIAEAKAELAKAKSELEEALSRKSSDVAELEKRTDEDFSAILEPRLLDEASYQRLLAETIKRVVVHNDKVEVELRDGGRFELPRIKVDGRGKKILPWSEVIAATESVDNLNDVVHYLIVFHGGDESRVLLERENYTIVLEP